MGPERKEANLRAFINSDIQSLTLHNVVPNDVSQLPPEVRPVQINHAMLGEIDYFTQFSRELQRIEAEERARDHWQLHFDHDG